MLFFHNGLSELFLFALYIYIQNIALVPFYVLDSMIKLIAYVAILNL